SLAVPPEGIAQLVAQAGTGMVAEVAIRLELVGVVGLVARGDVGDFRLYGAVAVAVGVLVGGEARADVAGPAAGDRPVLRGIPGGCRAGGGGGMLLVAVRAGERFDRVDDLRGQEVVLRDGPLRAAGPRRGRGPRAEVVQVQWPGRPARPVDADA